LFNKKLTKPKRVLVIGAGVAGAEAARVAAGLGHQVEIWESSDRLGGQIYLAVAAPDKEEVWPAWSYRWKELETLDVAIKRNVTVTEENLRAYAPDLVIVATGSRPRPSPVDLSGLDAGVQQLHAWDLLANPDLIARGAPFTIIGGGMVGIEVADLFATRGSAATIIEITGKVAPEMARNNRIDILLRLKQAGVRTLLNTSVQSARGRLLQLKSADGLAEIDAGAAVVTAIGPRAERSVVPVVERAGCEYVLVGDCNAPGDFMSAIRDGYFAAMSLRTRYR
jgi:pyruvate/2-oxoglutarate dehydrogenase complex dihydrolipoamide dehydrogenase (E3) component